VVEPASRWFARPRAPRIDIVVDAARRYLQRHDDRYDVIMLDAFYADGVPFHMTTLEFAELLHDRLTPGGVVAVNLIGALTGSGSRITRALWKTYASVFPTVRFHPVYEGAFDRTPTDVRNIILVATERAAPSREQLAATWADVRRSRAPGAPALAAAIRDRWERPVAIDDVPLLTDGYAPTDALLLD
jgi:spermidine synthase